MKKKNLVPKYLYQTDLRQLVGTHITYCGVIFGYNDNNGNKEIKSFI